MLWPYPSGSTSTTLGPLPKVEESINIGHKFPWFARGGTLPIIADGDPILHYDALAGETTAEFTKDGNR